MSCCLSLVHPAATLQCVNGMTARAAWEQNNKPNGEAGIQNIRKRARLLVESRQVSTPVVQATTPGARNPASGAGEVVSAPKPFRLRHDQVGKMNTANAAVKQRFDELYKAATEEWSLLVTTGKNGKGEMSADAVAKRFSDQLPAGCTRKLTGRSIREAFNSGRVGMAPAPRGPKPALPSAFVASVADFAQMQQLAGNLQKPRQLVAAAVASAAGTVYEESLEKSSQRAALCRRVRREMGLLVETSTVIDDRRWQWLTSTNLTTWFRGYIQILYDFKFIPFIPDDIWEIIQIEEIRLQRMTNGDESHQKLSSEGATSGPQSHVYINPELGRAGKRKTEYQKHATILAWVNYAGEVGPLHIMLATGAEAAKKRASATADESGIRIRPEWTFGVPRVLGRFGNPTRKVFEPTFVLNEKGGMQAGGLEMFVRQNLLVCYPNTSREWSLDAAGGVKSGPTFMQLDAGPDRYTDTSLGFRSEMWDRGLVLFPGLPNGTSANQVMDDLFGPYKGKSQQVIEDICSERILAQVADRSAPAPKLDFCDLGRSIDGLPRDPMDKRPFSSSFTPPKIMASTKRLGLAPIDLKTALAHPKVRDNSLDGARIEKVNQVVQVAASNIETIRSLGFNADALVVPVQVQAPEHFVAPPSDVETQWKAIKAAGACAGAHWAAVGAKAFNAPEVLGPAMERVKERLALDNQRVANKAENFATLLASAREIYDEMVEDEFEYAELSVGTMKTLVSYIFQARQQTGASKHTGNRAACLEFLESVSIYELGELIENPPAQAAGTSAVPAIEVVLAEEVTPLLQIAGPNELSLEIELPPRLSLQSQPPAWVEPCLADQSETASQLVGYFICYKWPARLGGWLVGKITEVNKDRKITVTDDKSVANFIVFYEADKASAHHHLSLACYAKSCRSKTDSWVLLA